MTRKLEDRGDLATLAFRQSREPKPIVDFSNVLVPYHGLEAMSVQQAEKKTGIPESTLRRWTPQFGLGRRVGATVRPWTLSRVALAMFLANDFKALAAYHKGIRREEIVARYYLSEDIGELLKGPLFKRS